MEPDRKRATKNRSVSLHKGDLELMEWGAEFLGCTKSEYLRSALRAFTMHLQAVSKKR